MGSRTFAYCVVTMVTGICMVLFGFFGAWAFGIMASHEYFPMATSDYGFYCMLVFLAGAIFAGIVGIVTWSEHGSSRESNKA